LFLATEILVVSALETTEDIPIVEAALRGQPRADKDEWTRLEAIVHFGPNTSSDKVMEDEAAGEKIRGTTKVGEIVL
jgi:hypothetical protein